MKTTLAIMLAVLLSATTQLNAQSRVTVEAANSDISYYLDLKTVASVFAEAKNIEDFERRLNDYESGISNLDLNNDGYIDYLRVVEMYENNVHLVVIQAILERDIYQDVATILVERDNASKVSVRIIGDPYIYGTNYIIEPVYYHRPVIYTWFWAPRYVCWHSPYYWSYYPTYYHTRPIISINIYRRNVIHYTDRRHYYNYSSYRPTNNYYNMRKSVSRNDYGTRHPERAFDKRNANTNVTSRRDFDRNDRAVSNNNRNNNNNNRNNVSTGARTNNSRPTGTNAGNRNDNVRTNTPNRVNSNRTNDRNISTTPRANTENRGVRTNTTQTERKTEARPANTQTRNNNASASSNATQNQAVTERKSTPAKPEARQATPARTETRQATPAKTSSSSNAKPAVSSSSSSSRSSSPSVSSSSSRSSSSSSAPRSSSSSSSSSRSSGGRR